MKTNLLLLFFILCFFICEQSNAGTKYSVNGGNWNDATVVWSNSSGGLPCGCSPSAGDDVVVEGSVVVVVTASPGVNYNSLTVQELTDGDNTELYLDNGITLTVDNGASGGDLNIIDVPGGSGSPYIQSSTASVLSIKGSVIINDGDQIQNDITLVGTATLKIGINFDLSAGGAVTLGTNSTVDYFGSGAQSVLSGYNYGILKFSGAGTKTFQSGSIPIKNSSATCFDPSGATSVVCTGTNINFAGSAQTIPGLPGNSNYDGLTIGSTGTKTFANSPIINISGALTLSGANLYSPGTSTINFNGPSSPQNIPMRSTLTYNNLILNNAGATGAVLITNNITTTNVTGNIAIKSGIFDNGGYSIAGNAGATFEVDNGAQFTLSATSGMPTGFGTYNLGATSTVFFNGSGTQTISAINYGNITSANNARIFASSGTIGIAGTFSPGSGTYTNTGSTVNFNGTINQTIPMPATAFYNDLQLNCTGGTGATLAAAVSTTNVAGNISVQSGTFLNGGFAIAGNAAKTFSVSNGAIFVLTGSTVMPTGFGTTSLGATSTVNFNGNGSQNIDALFYGNLTSSSTGSRTLASSGTIGIAGTFTTGTNAYTATGSTIDFNESGSQTIPSLPGSVNYNNITVGGSGTKSLGGNTGITGILNISAGTFDVNSHTFTLISNAAGTASIAAIPGGSDISGSITMQRYAPASANTNDWRFLSSPVTGATIAQWTDNFATSGFTGSTDPGNSFISIYSWNEVISGGTLTNGYVPASSTGDNISNGLGFWVYIGPTPVTFDVTGAPNKFSQSPPITYTNNSSINDGWNLIANPYPATIDWSSVKVSNVHVNDAIYIYNSATGTYASYVGGVPHNGGTHYIASQQAFWVQTNGASPSISMVESNKTAQNPTFFRSENTPNTNHYPSAFTDFPVPAFTNNIANSIQLTASGNGFSDETFIRFTSGATTNFDSQYDAWKLINPNPATPNFSSVMSAPQDFSINSLPPLTSDINIPLRLKVPTGGGTYTITRDSILMLPMSSCIILEDKATASMIDLRTTVSYSFTIADTTKAPRFILHIYAPITKKAVNVSCAGGNNGIAVAKGTGTGPWNYVWKNASGTTVQIKNNSSTSDTLFNLQAGIYTVQTSGGTCGTVTDTIIVNAPAPISLSVTPTNVSCNGMTNGIAMITASGGSPAYTYLWDNGQTTPSATGLIAGNYSVITTDSNGCTATGSVVIAQPSVLTNTVSETNVSCFGQSDGIAIATAIGGTPTYTYFWSNGQTTSSVTGLAAGNYSVAITDTNGCNIVSSFAVSQPAAVTAGFTASTYTIDLAINNNVNFTNTSSGASAYQWNFGDTSAINTSSNPSHIYNYTGTYTVTLISSDGACSDTTYKTITVINSNPLSVHENKPLSSSVNVVYENGEVFLLFSLGESTHVNVCVYTMLGEKISSQNNLFVKNEKIKLDLPHLAAGMYIAVSEMMNGIISKKILITR